ncbi:MAG TPA: DCC1-like thiol-disulfide oxidoreductase family protein, partial [Methylomirabilota bacterium]|nr:DCC1-like thiol-disulfide oxidoreductase family protein [Methylomirabilota bacterium]
MNGWTGGQYSAFRALLGVYVAVHFAHLVPWGAEIFSSRGVLPDGGASPLLTLFPNVLAVADGPVFVTLLLALAAGLGVALALGFHDRLAAVGIWYVLAATFGRNPLIANPALPYVGWLLLAHALLPPAPYGSWAARGAADVGTRWRLPQPIFVAAWVLMAVGYSYSGYTKLVSPSWVDGTALARVLDNPLARPGPLRDLLAGLPEGALRGATWGALALEAGFAPLALVRPLRPWLWAAMVGMHVGLMTVIDFADLTLGMLVLHGFTLDPGWIRPRAGGPAVVFYDGTCGLCHRFVRFLLAEDRDAAFRFAPLGGETFMTAVPDARRRGLPDSVVIRTADGRLLSRSAAVVWVLQRLGGVWRLAGALLAALPTGLADRLYDALARRRRSLFRAPTEACPLVAPDL